jgi:hypothetical protein
MRVSTIILSMYFMVTGIFLFSKSDDVDTYKPKFNWLLPSVNSQNIQQLYRLICLFYFGCGIMLAFGCMIFAKALGLLATFFICVTLDNPKASKQFDKAIFCHIHIAIFLTLCCQENYTKKRKKE